MSNDKTQKWANEQQKREAADRRSGVSYATCLHCGNSFPVSQGLVTSNGALCSVCDNRD